MKSKIVLISLIMMMFIFSNNIVYGVKTVTDKCPTHSGATRTTVYGDTVTETNHSVEQWCDYNGHTQHAPTGSKRESHKWINELENATCIETGRQYIYCSSCGYVKTNITLAVLGHDWGEYTRSDATCTTTGASTRSCKRCSETETITSPALNHSWSNNYYSDGSQHWNNCILCGVNGTKTNHSDTNPKNGHCDICNYSIDVIAPAVTFTPNGNLTYQKSHTVKVSIADNSGGQGVNYNGCKYIWSNDSVAPVNVSGFTDGTLTTAHATSGISTPVSKEGLWYLHVYVVDACGNNRIQTSNPFYLDNVSPVGNFSINGNALYTNSATINLTISANDNASGVSQMAISNSQTKGTYEAYSTSKTWTLEHGNGNKEVYIWFKDSAGNESQYVKRTIIYDTVVPSSVGTMTTTATANTIIASISGAVDASSGVNNYDYLLNGTTNASNQPSTYTYTGLTPNTTYTLNYIVRDNLNYTNQSANIQKTTLAAIPNSITASNGTSSNQITISWGANGNPSGTKYFVEYSEDGITWNKVNTTATTALTYNHTGLAKSKTYQYRVYAQNNDNISTAYSVIATGKTTQESLYDSIILDTTAPTATFTKNQITGFDGTKIDESIKVDITEAFEVSVLKYVWTTNNTKLTAENQFTDGSFVSGQSIEPAARITNGNCYLQVYARDAIGNVGIYVSPMYTVIPTVSNPSIIINNNALYTKNTDLTLTLSASNAKYMYISEQVVTGDSIAASSWETYATSKNYNLSNEINGERRVYAYYKDVYGNVVINSDVIIFDNMPPHILNITGTQYKNTASGGTVNVTASGFSDGGGSGIKECRWAYRIGEGVWTYTSWTTTTNSSSYDMPVTVEGKYTVKIEVNDNCENARLKETTVVIDRTAPTIESITGAQTINVASGAKINIVASGFQDVNGSGIESYTWEYKLGDGSWATLKTENFKETTSNVDVPITSEGVYTVRIGVKDKAGNVGYKETTIDVDRTIPYLGTLNMTATLSSITATVTDVTDTKGTIAGYEFYIDGIFKSRQTSNVYTYTGLECTKGYNITYKIFDNYGNYTAMSPKNIKYTLANVPTNVVGTDKVYSTKIDVTWSANGNTTDGSINNAGETVFVTYEVTASDDGTNWTSALYKDKELMFIHRNIGVNTKKYYRVRAFNQEGIASDYSATGQGATDYDNKAPFIYLESVENTTSSLPGYGDKADTIKAVINIEEENWNSNLLSDSNISIYVVDSGSDDTFDIEGCKVNAGVRIENITQTLDGAQVTIIITNVTRDGDLIIGIPAGTIIDAYGNKNAETHLDTDLIIDNTMPEMSITYTPTEWTKGDVTVTIEVYDKNGLDVLTFAGNELEVKDGKATHIVTERNYYVVEAIDMVGNKNTQNVQIHNIDKVAPSEVTLTSSQDRSGTEVLRGTAVDDLSGIAGFAFTTSNEVPTKWTEVTPDKNILKEFYTLDEKTYYFWVKDQVGNTSVSQPLTVQNLKGTMITEWTIPANIDGAVNGTTIKLPISSDIDNTYGVDWGDGTVERFDNTAFPSHTFKNTITQTYTIRIIGTVKSFGYYGNVAPTNTNSYSDYYTFTQYLTGLKKWGELSLNRVGFSYCTNLTGTIPTSENFEGLTSVENMFNNCTSLVGPIPTAFITEATNIISARNMFKNCSNLTGNIPLDLFSNNKKITTMESIFENASKIEGTIPENMFINTTNVETYAKAFTNCVKLTGNIPANLLKGAKITSNFYRMFYNCTGLEGEITPDLLKDNIVIDRISTTENYKGYTGMFENCTGITVVRLNTLVIGTDMFKGCTGITNIELGNVIEIGANAFYGCNKLTDITVHGKYLQMIGTDAFQYTGTNPASLWTIINRENQTLTSYNWSSDNRLVDVSAPVGSVQIETPKYPFTNQEAVTLKLTLTDDYSASANCMMAIVNELDYNAIELTDDYSLLSWKQFQNSIQWTLTENDGIKVVYVFFKDESGNVSSVKKEIVFENTRIN